MDKKVTIQDLATQLNLSTATVSRALSDHPLINADTKRAVAELADRLGYRSRQTARASRASRALGSARRKPIAWITPLVNFQFEDPIILEILGGMVSRAVELGRNFLHIPTDVGHELETYRELIASGEIGGFILANRMAAGDRRLEFLLGENVPFVAYGAMPADRVYPWVRVAYAEAYRMGADHLLDLGHRRLALLNAIPVFQASIEREAGFRAALAARGVPVSENWIIGGPKNEEFGYRSTQQLLESSPMPTGIVCSNVLSAKGALFAIAERRLEVGKDISLVAFDDNIAGSFYSTPLTTMFSPVRPLGRCIVDFLERAMNGESHDTLKFTAHAELVVRSSTGPPRESVDAPAPPPARRARLASGAEPA